jgi:ribosomal-protein-alanine N-acetyltransferase
MDEPTIISLTKNDLSAVALIERAGQQYPWSDALLAEELNNQYACHFAALFDHGKTIGAFILCRLFCEELHIHHLCTDPLKRRRGLATALLRHTLSYARRGGAKTAFIEVRSANAPARTLYEREGFSVTSIRKTYYSNGDDALIMQRSLH